MSSQTSPKLLEMIEQLIALPSVSSTHAKFDTSNQAVINLLANWLNDLGFNSQIIPSKAGPNKGRKVNLISWIGPEGTEGDDGLVLSGHTDTVNFDQTGWKFDPFIATQHNDKLYGLGTADMKSFLAIAIEAAKEFDLDGQEARLEAIGGVPDETRLDLVGDVLPGQPAEQGQ